MLILDQQIKIDNECFLQHPHQLIIHTYFIYVYLYFILRRFVSN
jgi:hypothetical protein